MKSPIKYKDRHNIYIELYRFFGDVEKNFLTTRIDYKGRKCKKFKNMEKYSFKQENHNSKGWGKRNYY